VHLAKEIFSDIKWWIIVLDASPCKGVFCKHQRCVHIPLLEIPSYLLYPVGALKLMFLPSSTQQRSDPVLTFTTLLGTKPLTYVKFTKDLKGVIIKGVTGDRL